MLHRKKYKTGLLNILASVLLLVAKRQRNNVTFKLSAALGLSFHLFRVSKQRRHISAPTGRSRDAPGRKHKLVQGTCISKAPAGTETLSLTLDLSKTWSSFLTHQLLDLSP